MKNRVKMLGLLLASTLTLVGCGDDNGNNYGNNQQNNNTKTTWSDDEKAILNQNLYGIDLPYMYFENEGSLVYDSEHKYASKSAPTCTKELLDAYGDKFDNTWNDYSVLGVNEDGAPAYYYAFEKKITTDAGVRNVAVCLYAESYDSQEKDYVQDATGNGRFCMEVYDPYDYEWPTEVVSGLLTILKSKSNVPSLDGADLYEVNDYSLYGFINIIASTNEAKYNSYLDALENAGYKYVYTEEEYEIDAYANENKDIYIYVGFYEGNGESVVEITIQEYFDYYYEWPTDAVADCLTIFEATSTVPAFNGAEHYTIDTRYLYEGEFGVLCYTDDANCVNQYKATLTTAGYTFVEDVDYGDDGIYSHYENETQDISIEIAYDSDEGTLDIYVDVIEGETGGGSSTGGGTTTTAELNLAGDTITAEVLGLTKSTTNSYISYSATTECGATYSGVLSNAKAIQINSNKGKHSGLIAYNANAYCEAIGFAFNKASNGDTLNIFASNEPFTIDEMLNGTARKVGTAKNVNGVAVFEFEEDYSYIGFVSNDGAINLDKIVYSWIDKDPTGGQEGEGGQAGEGGQQGEDGQQGEGGSQDGVGPVVPKE